MEKSEELKMSTQTMMLYAGEHNGFKTFKMIPLTSECPYNEALFIPTEQTLAIVSKEKKDQLHMIPRLDGQGDIEYLDEKSRRLKKQKNGEALLTRENGKTYMEQRHILETYYEYYITGREDIEAFIAHFAMNEKDFDYKKFFTTPLIKA